MRRKRIVSSIAALAMAASAFAGMAVTTSAAEIKENDVVFGVYDAETKTVSPQTEFTVDNGEGETYTYLGTTYMEGSVLVGNQGGGRTYNFETPVTDGEVKLAMDYTIPASGTKNVWQINGTNTAGENVVIAASVSGIDRDNWADVTLLSALNNNGETETVIGTNYQPRERNCFILRDLTINLDKKKLTYEFVTYRDGSSGQLTGSSTVVSGSINIPNDIASVIGLEVPRNGSSYNMNMDNIMFYHIPKDEDAAISLTVNYMSGDSNLGNKIIDVSSNKVGDTVDYTFPAYVTGTDGTVYYSGVDSFKSSKQLGSATDTVDVSYSPVSGIAQYMEFDGNISIANADKASNGAMTNGIQDGIETIKVNADGVYTVTIATGRTSEEATSNRNGAWYVNNNTESQKELSFDGLNPGAHVYEDVQLHSGDVIKVDGFNSKCALDYVLIVKTGELEPEPSEPETTKSVTKISESVDKEGSAAVSYMAKFDVTGSLGVNGITWTITGAGEKVGDTKPVSDKFENQTTVTDGAIVFGLVIEAQSGLDTIGSVDAELQ